MIPSIPVLRGRHEVWRMPPPGGARVAGYEIVAEIGRGGMGVVYLAEAEGGELVAIKTVLPDHRDDHERLAMIADEAALTARLEHPHIVSVRELARDDGTPALVLDYVHGEALSALLVEITRLPAAVVARIGADVAGALAAAADSGVVHRDVAPHNVLVGYDGSVKLGDFGIAWAAEGREAVTAAGVVKGRVAYMAPEQLAGDAVTAAADVYALAVVLIRALAGRMPARDPDSGRHLELPATIDPDWRDLLAAATADDPGARCEASELGARLEALASERGELAEILCERFAESRALKDSIIERGGDLASSETEVLDGDGDTADATATERVSPARRRWTMWALAAIAAAGVVAAAVMARRAPLALEIAAPPVVAAGPPCVVAGDIPRAADRDPTYVAVRLVHRLLGRAAIAGFRDEDRCPPGARRIAVTGSSDGRASISDGQKTAPVSALRPASQAAAMVAALDLGPAGPELSDHSWRRYLRLLKIREVVYLMAEPGGGDALDAAVREDAPDLEHVYVINALRTWIAGRLEPEILPRPDSGSEVTRAVLDAIVAMAAGDTDTARERASVAVEAAPAGPMAPLVDLMAGEAAFHGGDPVTGVAAFERALAAEPDLLAAIYHLARHRLARGDWAGVEALADHWERRDPAAAAAADLRARSLAGRGDYPAALVAFEEIVREGIGGQARSAEVGRILALAMAGRERVALEAARALSETSGGEPSVAAVTPELAGYALALRAGDSDAVTYWASRLDLLLSGEWVENHIALAVTSDLIDHLAGADREPRLAGDPPPARRRYRYRDRVALLHLLRGRDTAVDSTLIAAVRRALEAGDRGDVAAAEAAYAEALDSTAEGSLDCAILWRWAELARTHDLDSREAICARLAQPRVPTALCIAARCDSP